METIVIATDFSGPSMNAAQYAAKLSGDLGIKSIILYHSYDNAPKGLDIPVHENEDTTLAHEGSLLALEILMEKIKPLLSKGTDINIIANDLPLVLGIDRLCDQHNIRLVVAGTTGKSDLKTMLVGSNTISLAEKCPAPLLIVPREAEFERIEKIVFACAMEKVLETTPVNDIHYFTKQLEAKLLVLNVIREDKAIKPAMVPQQYLLDRLLDGLQPSYHFTEEDEIAEGIMDFADDKDANLVITIPKKFGFFESLFKRSVTKKLAYHTEIPLLILKGKEK